MSDLISDEMLKVAQDAIARGDYLGIGGRADSNRARLVLDAVAPLIAAKALRDAAESLQRTLTTGRVASTLRERADEIEGKA